MHRLFTAITLSVFVQASIAAPPARVEIAYEVSRNGTVIADVIGRLEHDGRTYRLIETWSGRGLLALRGEARRTSTGTVTPAGLKPRDFSDERSGRPTARAWFDRDAGTLTLQYKKGPAVRPLPPNTLDRASFLFDLAFRPAPKGPFEVSVTNGRGVSTWTYEPAGREQIRTAAGVFEAEKLVRRRKHADERQSIVWLATGHDRMPLRVLVIDKDGNRLDRVATRISAP